MLSHWLLGYQSHTAFIRGSFHIVFSAEATKMKENMYTQFV